MICHAGMPVHSGVHAVLTGKRNLLKLSSVTSGGQEGHPRKIIDSSGRVLRYEYEGNND